MAHVFGADKTDAKVAIKIVMSQETTTFVRKSFYLNVCDVSKNDAFTVLCLLMACLSFLY